MNVRNLHLSAQARSIWGKTNRVNDEQWLPLYVHLADSIAMTEHIWDTWAPPGTKNVIAQNLGGDTRLARTLVTFLAGVHDIGKATPIFQLKPISFVGAGASADEGMMNLSWKPRNAGLPIQEGLRNFNQPTHPIAGQAILERYCEHRGWTHDVARSYASVVGGHHGTPPDPKKLRDATHDSGARTGFGIPEWENAQNELIAWVRSRVGLDDGVFAVLGHCPLEAQTASLITGLTVMADWIASNSDTDLFPLMPLHPDVDDVAICETIESWKGLEERAERAWRNLNLTAAWRPSDGAAMNATGGSGKGIDTMFRERFSLPSGASPRPVQRESLRVAAETPAPGLMIIEAPMGEGKTEAALAAAEALAYRTGRGGVCVALPTMATTDAMFGRVHEWLETLPQQGDDTEKTVWLAHGKAQLNDEFQGIVASSRRTLASIDVDADADMGGVGRRKGARLAPETVVSDWMWGRKKGVLANFLVCTVDQVLMGALEMKHVVLRQLALVNKIVIIDECHAYDSYMQEYLKRILEWLGACHTPVVLLSATLPERQRQDMVNAYLGRDCAGVRDRAELTSAFARSAGVERHDPRAGRRRSARLPQITATVPKTERDDAATDRPAPYAYPLITYTSNDRIRMVSVPPSGRSSDVECRVIEDGDEALTGLMKRLLAGGGCAGVICDTVGRAQRAATMLRREFDDCVRLTHSRFMDIDRMDNERELRRLLGPSSTIANGKRPDKLIVVGTQVLEQSLDIDFDVLVTDVAPVDLLMQRLGRVHRHHRGDGESDRPTLLRSAVCYVRGVESWAEEGPVFARGVDLVYAGASLMESLAVLGLQHVGAASMQFLPKDIARTVRDAYGDARRSLIPVAWLTAYDRACARRDGEEAKKRNKANGYRIPSVRQMNRDERSLTDWFTPRIDENDEDKGQRAVRDTQETVEVMLLRKADGEVRLLPWVGDDRHGVSRGEAVETETIPDNNVAKLAAQCSVRLPLALCRPDQLDKLIAELEDGCAAEAMVWQESTWLAGRLAVFLNEDDDGVLTADLYGYRLTYSREYGLQYEKLTESAK